VLLVRLLAAAPRCEDWSWECCTALLQLLVSCQQAAGAASNLLYATLAASSLQCDQSDTQQKQQQQQRQQGDGQQQQVEHAEAARAQQVKLLAALKVQVAQRLLPVLHGLHRTEEALQHCSSSGSSSSDSSSSISGPQQQASSQGRGRKAMQVVQDDMGQQQEALAEFSQPAFWRSETFQLYTTSRSSGSALLKGYFHDWRPDNHRPRFWGVVSV
jgi:hypothetical protein